MSLSVVTCGRYNSAREDWLILMNEFFPSRNERPHGHTPGFAKAWLGLARMRRILGCNRQDLLNAIECGFLIAGTDYTLATSGAKRVQQRRLFNAQSVQKKWRWVRERLQHLYMSPSKNEFQRRTLDCVAYECWNVTT